MVDWEGILSRDGPAVWRCAYRLLGRHDEAEECFQETFLAAVRAWEGRRVESARALLLRLATARAMDRLRARYRQTARAGAGGWDAASVERVSDRAPAPPALAEAAELSAMLRAALATLPPRQAEAFCLSGLEGWSYQEIAAELNVSIDAVGVLLHRARAKLRILLATAAPVPRRRGR